MAEVLVELMRMALGNVDPLTALLAIVIPTSGIAKSLDDTNAEAGPIATDDVAPPDAIKMLDSAAETP